MNKVKFLTIISIILFIVNIGIVVFFFFAAPHPRNAPKLQGEIIKELQLDEAQVEKYKTLVMGHQQKNKKLDGLIMEQKNKLYDLLKVGAYVVGKEQIMDSISVLTIQLDSVNFAHFEDIKSLCTTEQLPAFNDLVGRISSIFGSRNNGNSSK